MRGLRHERADLIIRQILIGMRLLGMLLGKHKEFIIGGGFKPFATSRAGCDAHRTAPLPGMPANHNNAQRTNEGIAFLRHKNNTYVRSPCLRRHRHCKWEALRCDHLVTSAILTVTLLRSPFSTVMIYEGIAFIQQNVGLQEVRS
jgi:hypothetical protein